MRLEWGSGQSVLAWPIKHLPLHDGAVFLWSLGDGTEHVVTFRRLDADFGQLDFDEQLKQLEQFGCHEQAERTQNSPSPLEG
jgi:hypothetical protein